MSRPLTSSISDFLAKPWIWEQLAPAEHVLLFSKNSVLCEKSRKNVDDFADFDVISSKEPGLSLRNRRMLLEITRQASFIGLTINEAGEEVEESEHQWLESIMRGPALGSVWSSPVKLPSDEDVIDFAGKEWSDERPLGFSMSEIWNDEDVKQIEEWCPEVMLCFERSVGISRKEETKAEEVLTSVPIPLRIKS